MRVAVTGATGNVGTALVYSTDPAVQAGGARPPD